jgi:hypothetical protein
MLSMSRSHCGKSPWYTAANEEITESGCSYLDAPYDKEELTLDRTNGKRSVGRLCSVLKRTRSGRVRKHATVAVLSQPL